MFWRIGNLHFVIPEQLATGDFLWMQFWSDGTLEWHTSRTCYQPTTTITLCGARATKNDPVSISYGSAPKAARCAECQGLEDREYD